MSEWFAARRAADGITSSTQKRTARPSLRERDRDVEVGQGRGGEAGGQGEGCLGAWGRFRHPMGWGGSAQDMEHHVMWVCDDKDDEDGLRALGRAWGLEARKYVNHFLSAIPLQGAFAGPEEPVSGPQESASLLSMLGGNNMTPAAAAAAGPGAPQKPAEPVVGAEGNIRGASYCEASA